MAVITSSVDFFGACDGGKPYSLRYEPPNDFPRTNFTSEAHIQSIEDIRGREETFSVHKQGFALMRINRCMRYEDFDNKGKVETDYFKQVAEGVQTLLGASRVQIFEHVLRKRHAEFPIATGQPYKYDQPTTRAHIGIIFDFDSYMAQLTGADMTPDWAMAMAEHMNERSGIELPSPNFQFINIWKPLRGPVKDWPLALCDGTTLADGDLQPMDIVHSATVIETYLVRPNTQQKWYYVRDQLEDEAWVFLQATSMNGGQPGIPHSSFLHPAHTESEFPRESIEVRAIAFYDEQQ